ncbi:hypothetical protein NPIL_449111 [Nephila pilipes]|uniref:Uncharacterized protein n=1 Tax=Nephila pilipes TaxID=299642 RepID=A0A8X6U638_NEPPI|nr:hypothetical protein NPIL_449111 [Nephila pilipes]
MSLEHLALVRTAVYVYRTPEFSALEKGGEKPMSGMPSKKWESLVKKKLPKLKNCSKLLKRVSNLMRPLSEEAYNRRADHFFHFGIIVFPTVNRLSLEIEWND